jgi:uncharacterized protein YndB with AHSA1/START domain
VPAETVPDRVRISRTLPARREKVFRAWTDPHEFLRWFGEPGSTMRIVKFDAREGGAYDIEGESGGELWRVSGAWREFRPPERLVFTWNSRLERPVAGRESAAASGSGDTLVTVELYERGASTEIVLVHEGFTSEVSRRSHDEGWIGCLDRMAVAVE